MDFYKRFPADYGKGTGHLSLAEHGAYTLMLDWVYATERDLPPDIEAVCRICRATTAADRDAVRSVLEQFWTQQLTGWTQDRVTREIALANARGDVARQNGARGGRPADYTRQVPRETKPRNNPGTNPQETQGQTQDLTHKEPTAKATQTLRLSDSENQQLGGSPGGDPPPPTRSEAVPFQRIVDIYNSTMTRLPKVQALTEKRKRLMRAFWQINPQFRSTDFVQQYFEECEDDAFMNGTGPYGNGHQNWRPDFDYLLRQDVVVKVYERALSRPGSQH